MHVLFVLCHPEPASLNAALTQTAVDHFRSQGDTAEVSDLYAEGFDPVEKAAHYGNRENEEFFAPMAEQRHAWTTESLHGDVTREIARLEKADLVILQFPIWWHSIPAMLKGWFDRVFVGGGLYTSTMRYDRGYFRGKRAICSVTAGAPAAAHEPGGRGGEIDQILWSTNYSFYYMGYDVLPPFEICGVQGHGFSYADEAAFEKQIETAKSDWIARLGNIDQEQPMPFPGWDDWDEMGRPLKR